MGRRCVMWQYFAEPIGTFSIFKRRRLMDSAKTKSAIYFSPDASGWNCSHYRRSVVSCQYQHFLRGFCCKTARRYRYSETADFSDTMPPRTNGTTDFSDIARMGFRSIQSARAISCEEKSSVHNSCANCLFLPVLSSAQNFST